MNSSLSKAQVYMLEEEDIKVGWKQVTAMGYGKLSHYRRILEIRSAVHTGEGIKTVRNITISDLQDSIGPSSHDIHSDVWSMFIAMWGKLRNS